MHIFQLINHSRSPNVHSVYSNVLNGRFHWLATKAQLFSISENETKSQNCLKNPEHRWFSRLLFNSVYHFSFMLLCYRKVKH